jgi:cellulose biosynthesis protein BcsQ
MMCAYTGGLGKSTLAYKVYTEMKSMTVFTDSKYVTFDLDEQSSDNAVILEVQRWLLHPKGPVLLVLDNAQRQQQVDSIINDANIKANSFVLITSRRRDLVAPIDLYDMPIMNNSYALELFRWHSQRPGTAGVIKTRVLKV